MARKYRYTDFKTGKVLYEGTHPNYVSDEDVDKIVLKKTGRDPRLERALIDREIRMIGD
jgi:hypothetical protein